MIRDYTRFSRLIETLLYALLPTQTARQALRDIRRAETASSSSATGAI
jgi:hypothetical protein